ncbi:MAG: nuclease-related domain-containing protein [Desulfocapsaceae bacterium]|nr:nuclease-related domain-containing protein [Desulfocapsaceae bacterium]
MSLFASPYLWLLLLLVVGAAFLKSPIGKGIVGEIYVNLLLRFSLDKAEYYLCKNVTLPTDSGTTQIDHLIVSRYGIFVVETKNMKGWIYGGERQKTWTQKIFKNTRSFQNPLRQNFKHTKTLAELIGIHHRKIISLIIFVGDSSFKTAMPTNVVQGRQCLQFIRAHNNPVFTRQEIAEIMMKIEQLRLPQNLKTHREYVAYLKRTKNNSPPEMKRRSLNLRPMIMLALLAIFSSAAIFAFITINSDSKDQLPSVSATGPNKAKTDVQQIRENPHNTNKNSSKELIFSDEQIHKAAAELLNQQKEVNTNDTDAIADTYIYQIELFSGGMITTDNATIKSDKITYTDKKGFIVSINKEEIRTLKKVKVQQ